tara:strand:- start:221 stop:724 length:504 start_codon:yes stop_codon:yes gene_type:complete
MEGIVQVQLVEWLNLAVTLFCVFLAQGVALFIAYRMYKFNNEKEQRRIEERQEDARRRQLEDIRQMIDNDLGTVRDEVADVRNSVSEQDRLHKAVHEQLHGRIGMIEKSRPTREEMDRNLLHHKELILSMKGDLERTISVGFKNVDRRFDEFKEYTRDVLSARGRDD